jgi:hypothetical protein
MIDYNVIRDNLDRFKALIRARKTICDLRNELNYVPKANKIVNQELINGFNEAIKQIEIRILFVYGIKGVNNDNFNEYENIILDILEAYRRVCYLDKIRE